MSEDTGIRTMRLQRFLARAGVASRRGSENLMTAGRVCVNGKLAQELGTKVDPEHDCVTVDGREVTLNETPHYLVLNKPAGYLTTMSDPQGRNTVAELVPLQQYPGLFPVGRLDFDTEGVLLFTTDGDMAQALLHPSKHVEKRYVALVYGKLLESELEPLRQGIELDDGPCQPAPCKILSTHPLFSAPHESQTLVEISLREGRNRQVKRMLDAIGHPVMRLVRTEFAGLTSKGLKRGEYRLLRDSEVAILKASTQ